VVVFESGAVMSCVGRFERVRVGYHLRSITHTTVGETDCAGEPDYQGWGSPASDLLAREDFSNATPSDEM
jgi:hypothetical protein